MLRRSLCCQQNKLSFSKSNWYNLVIQAVLPEKPCFQRAIRFQFRATATLATALDDLQDATPSMSPKAPPLLTPLEPLKVKKIKAPSSSSPTIMIKNRNSTSYFKRCSGYKKYSGKPCTRLVKVDPAIPDKEQYYCFNHDPLHEKKLPKTNKKDRLPAKIKKIIFDKSVTSFSQDKEIFKAPSKIYDCWQLWIGDHIKPKHKALIRQEMKRPLSDRDQSGYIYAYHLEDGPRVSQMDYAYFKIGRTTDPHRRMYQVTHACNYIPKIIELIPSFPKHAHDDKHRLSNNLEAMLEQHKNDTTTIDDSYEIPKCPMSHRVERLIHLELASLYEHAGFKCDQCGSMHREWIRVNRRKHDNGKFMTDQELWKSDIRPIVLRWIQFGVVASALK